MAEFNEEDTAKAIRKLAEYTEEVRDKLVGYAVSYNVNIIGGSLPLLEDGKLYNVFVAKVMIGREKDLTHYF